MLQSDSEYFYFPKGLKEHLSQHFLATEFQCPCSHPNCTNQRVSRELINRLESVRDAISTQLAITSGYRCPEYQADLKTKGYETAIGHSQHELGNAADLTLPGRSSVDLTTLLLPELKKSFKAIGVGRSFIHVDLRSDKERSWTYLTR